MRVQRRRSSQRWRWLDLRLVPPALAIWATTLLLAGRGPAVGLLLGVGSVGAAVLLSRVGARSRWRWAAVSVLAGVAAAVAVSAVRAGERSSSPLLELAARGAITSVVLTVDDDPRVLPGGLGPPRVLVSATVIGIDRSADLRAARVLVFGPTADWRGVLPGSTQDVRVAVRPAEAGDDVVAVLSARAPPAQVRESSTLQRIAGNLRSGLAAAAQRVLPDRPAGLLPGLVVGDTSAMDSGLTSQFRRAGLGHLTAVSGANVAIVLTLLLWPLRRRAVDRRWQALLGLLGLAAFVIVARPSPSVLRAAVMGAIGLLALAGGRPRAAIPALAGAVAVLILVDPQLARDAGFALSVAATAGIVVLSPGWSRSLRRRGLPGPLADALAVSAAAGLVTAPLVAGVFGLVSAVSLPANLLAAPAVAPATVLGLLATLTAPVSPDLADLLVWLAGWPTRWLVGVAERAAAVPDGATGWPTGVLGALLLAMLLVVVVLVLVRWPRSRPLALAALVGVVLLGVPVREVTRGWPVPGTVLVACDVGQGDALVLPVSAGAAILVDAGPQPALIDGCLRRLGIDALPLVLLSHLDADHAGGLAGALQGRAVGEVSTGVLSSTEDRIGAIRATVSRAGGRLTVLPAGATRIVGTATVAVLAPDAADAASGAEANDLSMLVRITQRGLRLLMTGDLGADRELRLLLRGIDLRADVLKVPHHGSADADPDFLAATGARVALISVGADNSYGHPTARLLDWLRRDRMRMYRTDRDGDVAVLGEAEDWGVSVRGPDAVQHAVAAAERPTGPATGRICRSCVTPWRRVQRRSPAPHLAAEDRGG